jgi:pyrroline-5-carboxylate reductase
MEKVTIIGGGNMGGAIAFALQKTGEYQVTVVGRTIESLKKFEQVGIRISNDIGAVRSDIVILAIKPQVFGEVLPQIKDTGAVFVSIAAGVTIESIKAMLGTGVGPSAGPSVRLPRTLGARNDEFKGTGTGVKVVRAMPNTPALIGEGVTALAKDEATNSREFEMVKRVFETCGEVAVVAESQMHAVVALSGSSPAYAYMFLEAMLKSGVDNGVDYETAKLLAANALKGASSMVLASDETPDELCKKVCSKGGTTIEAVKSLQAAGFEQIVEDAMQKCIERSIEMSK